MRKTILLVDDEAIVLKLMQRVMSDIAPQCDLIAVPDGATALALLEQYPIHLIITDQRMPDMDGISLCKAIRERNVTEPIVMITAWANEQLMQNAEMVGVDFFLTKPFTYEQMIGIMKATSIA